MKTSLLSIVAGAGLSLVAGAATAATLADVVARGFVQCGVDTGHPGFSAVDDQGNWSGFDVDYCRAIAAAVFGDPEAVAFTPLSTKERFTALQSGDVDVLARTTTWTMTRDTAFGLTFAGINYYGGQGLAVRKSLGVSSALELSGASICVQSGTIDELNLAAYFDHNNMTYNPVAFDKPEAASAAYDAGRCDALTTHALKLHAIRLTLSDPDEHMVLPETISKEPLGPVVRQGDDQWFNIVKWVHFALLNAEELGVTAANVDQMKSSDNQEIRRLLGTDGTFGEAIGLSNDWAANAIKALGNYGEIFERNVGASSPLKIARGLNALWSKGGIQYAPPIR